MRTISFTVVSPNPLRVAFFAGMLCTRVDRARAPHPDVDLRVSSCVALRHGLRLAESRMFGVSNDIDNAFAPLPKKRAHLGR